MLKFLKSNYLAFFLLVLMAHPVIAQELVINEVMSANQTVIYDEEGDTPDWIEVYNPGPNTINLLGYGLSDSLENTPWTFPDLVIEAGRFADANIEELVLRR